MQPTRRSLNLILTTILLLCANCARSQSPASGLSADDGMGANRSSSSQIIGVTALYTKLVYDSTLSLHAADPELVIDLVQPAASVMDHSCVNHDPRVAAVRDILAQAQVCQPVALAGSANCLAIANPDIQLTGSNESLQLAPQLCNRGTFLCHGDDAKLRALLSDLVENPCFYPSRAMFKLKSFKTP